MCGSWRENLRWEAWTADRDSRLNVPMSTHEPLPDRPPAKASWTEVSTYFVLAFAISWGGVAAAIALALAGQQALPRLEKEVEKAILQHGPSGEGPRLPWRDRWAFLSERGLRMLRA